MTSSLLPLKLRQLVNHPTWLDLPVILQDRHSLSYGFLIKEMLPLPLLLNFLTRDLHC